MALLLASLTALSLLPNSRHLNFHLTVSTPLSKLPSVNGGQPLPCGTLWIPCPHTFKHVSFTTFSTGELLCIPQNSAWTLPPLWCFSWLPQTKRGSPLLFTVIIAILCCWHPAGVGKHPTAHTCPLKARSCFHSSPVPSLEDNAYHSGASPRAEWVNRQLSLTSPSEPDHRVHSSFPLPSAALFNPTALLPLIPVQFGKLHFFTPWLCRAHWIYRHNHSLKFQRQGTVPFYSLFKMTKTIRGNTGPAAPEGKDIVSFIFASLFPG